MKLVFVILLTLLIALQINIWIKKDGYKQMKEIENLIDLQTIENESLTKRNNRLKEEIKDMKNGQDAIEEKARTDIGMIKEGEEFFLINEGNENKVSQ
ncbi:MAG: septum formation initiator family protein [Gammaproteobacteria bacterium]|nr:cell division protein FtsB [Gammaproteobacteria bacterium]MDG2434987.1 septum formation initiator family protein [Gammaproteobacteria bacterium]